MHHISVLMLTVYLPVVCERSRERGHSTVLIHEQQLHVVIITLYVIHEQLVRLQIAEVLKL